MLKVTGNPFARSPRRHEKVDSYGYSSVDTDELVYGKTSARAHIAAVYDQTSAGGRPVKNFGSQGWVDHNTRIRERFTGRDLSLLGSYQANANYRQDLRIGKGGNVFRIGGATTAIRGRVQEQQGRFGFSTFNTGRYRNPYQSRSWNFQLYPSKGPNKAPHGISQSSRDTTKEQYSTAETRFEKTGMFRRSEQWDSQTQKFERQWKGWEDLKINKTWKHYSIELAPMFKNRSTDIGLARRATRDTRTQY